MDADDIVRGIGEPDGGRRPRAGRGRGAPQDAHMSFWQERRVLLTGGGGFLGGFLRERIERLRPAALFAPRRDELDLRDPLAVRAWLRANQPDLVIHAAAAVGGIGANSRRPGL